MQIIDVVAGGPCEGILEVGDEIIYIASDYVEGMKLQAVSTLLQARNQEDEITFIITRGESEAQSTACNIRFK